MVVGGSQISYGWRGSLQKNKEGSLEWTLWIRAGDISVNSCLAQCRYGWMDTERSTGMCGYMGYVF